MIKIKIIAVFSILLFIGMVISNSRSFSSAAKSDVIVEIAKYKSWAKITEKPIGVDFQSLLKVRSDSASNTKQFTIDNLSGGG